MRSELQRLKRDTETVSYTHLDVYKRQLEMRPMAQYAVVARMIPSLKRELCLLYTSVTALRPSQRLPVCGVRESCQAVGDVVGQCNGAA